MPYIPTAEARGFTALSVTITADDGKGGSASTSFSVTVTPTNRPPVWVTIPDKTVQEGSTLTILLTTYASDPDGDTLISMS